MLRVQCSRKGIQLVTGGLFKKSPFTTAQKRQIAGGNPQPVDDVRDEKAREREREVKAVEERRRIAEEEQARNNEFYQKMIATPESTSV